MLILYIIIATFIAWIWVDYYRLIDIFENDKLKYFILTFLLGCASVLIVFGLNRYLLDYVPFELNGEFVNDFLYSVFKIGLVEELAKTIPFLIIFSLFKKQINEPLDYLAFFSVSALGFSAAENVLYFQNNGPYIINNRAILATVGHMFDTSLIAYGIIRYKFYHKGSGLIGIILFFFLAALSHGFYDFWLLYEGTQSGGWIITVFYFLLTISVFAVILNNAINNSSFFSYKKVINSKKVAERLLAYYGLVFLAQFVLLIFFEDFMFAFRNLAGSIYFSGFIVIVSCVRLSRFKLIKDRWENLKLELPFIYAQDNTYGMRSARYGLKIKGESYNEAYVNVYFEEYFSLIPLSKNNTYLGNPRKAYIERKIFLKNDETFYLGKVFHENNKEEHEKILLKPKTSGTTILNKEYPIVAVLTIDNITDIENSTSTTKNIKFMEWAYIKPQTEETTK
jgi:RsiW-degrading membrane proteinase PrsW (M82 family)